MARPLDMGESLVGAYLRYGEACDFVVYDTQTEGQGEIDVIGFQVEQRRVWLCEVATHLDGLLYGSGGVAGTLAKVRQKVERALAFSEEGIRLAAPDCGQSRFCFARKQQSFYGRPRTRRPCAPSRPSIGSYRGPGGHSCGSVSRRSRRGTCLSRAASRSASAG